MQIFRNIKDNIICELSKLFAIIDKFKILSNGIDAKFINKIKSCNLY